MLKKLILYICLGFCSFTFAQTEESEQFIRSGLIRSTLAIEPGFFIHHNMTNTYLTGKLEGYLDNKVSMRGEANYMVGSKGLSKDSIGLANNHSLSLGFVFHKHTNGHFDPYIAVMPGWAYTSSYKKFYNFLENREEKITYAGSISPLAMVGVGFNYYFQRFAHLFFETRYIYGRHLSEAPNPLSLQELRVTFGLGFNVFTIKKKKPA
jgi:hypothetical protein